MSSVTLTREELRILTGYEQPKKQLAVLQHRGFTRAYIGRCGVVLERVHYEAVCNSTVERPRPKVKPPSEVRPAVRAPQ